MHGSALKLIEAVKNNQVLNEKTFVHLNSMLESIMSNDDNADLVVKYPLAPKKIKESTSRRAVMVGQGDHIKMKSKPKRSIDTCTTCEKRDPNNSKGHRKGANCPYHEDYCLICVKKGKFIHSHCSKTCPHNKKERGLKKSVKKIFQLKTKENLW